MFRGPSQALVWSRRSCAAPLRRRTRRISGAPPHLRSHPCRGRLCGCAHPSAVPCADPLRVDPLSCTTTTLGRCFSPVAGTGDCLFARTTHLSAAGTGASKQFRPRWNGPQRFAINEDVQRQEKVVILLNPDAQPGIDGVLADRAGNPCVHESFDQAFRLAKVRGRTQQFPLSSIR